MSATDLLPTPALDPAEASKAVGAAGLLSQPRPAAGLRPPLREQRLDLAPALLRLHESHVGRGTGGVAPGLVLAEPSRPLADAA